MFITVIHCTITCTESTFRKTCCVSNRALTIAIPKIPKSVVVQHIRVGAGKLFGVRMIFAWILPNLPEKLHKKWPTKKVFYVILGPVGCHFWSYFQAFAESFSDFVKVFWDFCLDFHRFFPDLHQIRTVRSHPHLLHQWCSIKSECCDKC